jgi:hypothetical protein
MAKEFTLEEALSTPVARPRAASFTLNDALGKNQEPDTSPQIGSPMGEDFGSAIMAASKPSAPENKKVMTGFDATPVKTPFFREPPLATDLMGNVIGEGMESQPISKGLPQLFQAEKPKPPTEMAMGEEAVKGAASGVIGLKSMWENAGVLKDVGALTTVQQRLDAFNKIDSGEIKDYEQLHGLDLTTSQARSYLASDPATREKMKNRLLSEAGNRKDFVKASIETINQYQKDAEKYRGRTTDLTDVEGAKDFANWLAFNVGSGTVQLAPIMLAAVTTGGAGVAALGTTMGVSEAVGNRMEALAPKIKDLPPDQKAETVAAYIQKTGDTSLGVGVISGAFDTLLGPAAALVKRGIKEVLKGETKAQALKAGIKEIPKQMGEEFIAGGGQEFAQQAGASLENEIQDLFTKETAKKVFNAAAAEAAGALSGGAGVTAARVYGATGQPEEKKPIGIQSLLTPKEKPIPSAEQMMRDRGFLIPEQKQTLQEILAEPVVTPPAAPAAPVAVTPPPVTTAPTDLATQRIEEQKRVLDLEQEMEAPKVEEAAPQQTPQQKLDEVIAEQAQTNFGLLPMQEAVTAEKAATEAAAEAPSAQESYTGVLPSAQNYDTPEFRLKQADVFGQDLMGELSQETDSYGRAAIKKKSLTNAYAEKKETLGDAIDAANVAFGSGDFAPFAQYTRLYPKTAAKIRAHINSPELTGPSEPQATPPTSGLTERQQRVAFGKSLGAVQTYPGILQGRVNLPAQTAAKQGDFTGVVIALEKSKNATVAEVARRAKGLGTKIQIDENAGETYEGRSAFQDQMSIDGAKMHLDALAKLRDLDSRVEQLPDGATLPYDVQRTQIDTYDGGEKYHTQLNLGNIVDNNNSMFTGLGLPEGQKLKTKEDFKTLLDAFERTTQELGEDKLRLTSTASAIQQGVAGKYDADTNTIYVPEYYAKNEAVLAHEIVHAQVVDAVSNPTPEQRPAVQRLAKLYEHVKKVVDEKAKADKFFRVPYGSVSQQEFIAEGLSNPDFQYFLSRISYENTTAWDKFTATIAKLLGLKNDNAFTELLTVYGDLNKRGRQPAKKVNDAEPVVSGPAPERPEVQELLDKAEQANKDIEALSKRTAGTSLMKVLQGSLRDSEMSELGGRSRQIGKNPFISLVAKKGKPGSSMEDMVESGALDLFLPEKMRPSHPSYDNQESAAYIREKLIQGQYYTNDTQTAIDNVTQGIWDLDKLIQEELSIDDINKEIQLAFDEQREADLNAPEVATGGEARGAPAGERTQAESDFLKAQTSEELKAKQNEIDRLTKENDRLAQEAERKAKADEQAGDFVLTGSNREADQAAARGQKDIFAEAPAEEAGITVVSDTKGKDDYDNTVTNIELSNGAKYQIVRLNSTESMGVPGWHDVNAKNIYGFLGNSKADAIETLIEQETAKKGKGKQLFQDVSPTKALPTDSAAFKRWFGKSKVVDADGKPLVVYHGSQKNFRKFELWKPQYSDIRIGGKDGAFRFVTGVTDDVGYNTEPERITIGSFMPIDASRILVKVGNGMEFVDTDGMSAEEAALNFFDVDVPTSERVGEGFDAFFFAEDPKYTGFYSTFTYAGENKDRPVTYPVYLSIKNPVDPDSSWPDFKEFFAEKSNGNKEIMRLIEAGFKNGRWEIKEAYPGFIDFAKSKGYDGFISFEGGASSLMQLPLDQKAPEGVKTWAAFEPTQIKSAIGNNGKFDPNNPNITQDISTGPVVSEEKKRNPSLKRKLDRLNRDREGGKLTDEQFIEGVDTALEDADRVRINTQRPQRTRGADFIRQRLLEAKRRGDLSDEAVDFAEWFIQKNPQLVDDLGISIRSPKEDGVSGQYFDYGRLMVLMKRSSKDNTAVHEILHHLERMMPPDMQNAIRKAWSKEFGKATQRATNRPQKDFFKLLGRYHWHGEGREADFGKAVKMIKDGQVPYDFYQYVNPSEFWAVNGTDIMSGRFDAVRGGVLARLKNWLKELGQKIGSMVGIGSQGKLIKALDSLSKGDGKFQSKEMLGESSTYASVGNTIFNQRPLVNWTSPEFTSKDKFIYAVQNRQIDTKRVIDEITKSIGVIDDRWNPYLMEELFHGRAAKQTKDFRVNELRPLLKEMGSLGVTIPQLEEYLHNKHAEERNDQIAKVNPTMPDGGSGIDTADARAYLAALTPGQKNNFDQVNRMVKVITGNTRQMLVDSGLESQDTIDTWEKTYGEYVPLNRDDVDYSSNQGQSVGQGFSVRGVSSKRAAGSSRKVVDILANIAMQRERTIVRAEKNRVATALYGLALKNPNPKFWVAVNPDGKKDMQATIDELVNMGLTAQDALNLMEEPTQTVIDPQTGLVTKRINPVLRGANNVMSMRVNGKDRFVFFNQNNESANRMATALKNLDADQLGWVMSNMAKATRFFASINTQYNPVFGVYNFLRDMEGATLQLSTTELAGKQKEVMKNVMPAWAGIYSQLRADHQGKVVTSQWSKLWEEFQQQGGQTGFRDQFSRAEERSNALERELKKMSQGKVNKAKDAIFNWLSDYNETMENAVRLAAYKAALDNGSSKDRAASLAKNLTVNFNRKGQIATQAGALYAFFNSAVQGTTRLVQTITGPAGKTILAGGFILGAIQAVGLAAMGFGDDDPPEFIKDKNFIIPLMNGKYLAIPMPLGYNVIPSTARILTEGAIDFAQGKKVNAPKRIAHMTGLLLDAFNPIGNAGWSAQTFTPTLGDPVVAIFENKDWTGKPIAKEDFNKLDPTPGYMRAKEAASIFGKKISEFINYASGGTKDVPGIVSPTPDQIDYLIGQATGGIGREVLKAASTAQALKTGEDLPLYKIPLVGRFYGDTKGSSSVANHFYDNIKKMNEYENTVKGMRARRENVQQLYKENPEARAYEFANEVEREVQKLRKLRHSQVEKDAPREAVQATEKRITYQMNRLNSRIESLEKKRSSVEN